MAERSARAEAAAEKPYRVDGGAGSLDRAIDRAIDEAGESAPDCPLAPGGPFAEAQA